MYDIIPDIHGQSEKLKHALQQLGYRDRQGAWRNSDPHRTCVFLGDFIDRGPDNAGVIAIVRRMIDACTASAIMGNHELNAILFHSTNPETGKPLRAHSDQNMRQHAAFLKDFPIGSPAAKDAVRWMQTLPLFREFPNFRVVHACWDNHVIQRLQRLTSAGVLSEEQFYRASDRRNELFHLVETTTKGPEAILPNGCSFIDKDGTRRPEIRIMWWNDRVRTWRDAAICVPDLADLPEGVLPDEVIARVYPPDEKPVLFGHYWLTGAPVLQNANALCLDYSAGKEGPLTTYRVEGPFEALALDNIVQHAA